MSSKTSLVAGKHFCVPESTRSGLWTRPRRYSVLPDRLSAVPEHLEPHFGSIFLKDEINGLLSSEELSNIHTLKEQYFSVRAPNVGINPDLDMDFEFGQKLEGVTNAILRVSDEWRSHFDQFPSMVPDTILHGYTFPESFDPHWGSALLLDVHQMFFHNVLTILHSISSSTP